MQIFCSLDLILYVQVNTFQFVGTGHSCVEPVLSKDICVLLNDTRQGRR